MRGRTRARGWSARLAEQAAQAAQAAVSPREAAWGRAVNILTSWHDRGNQAIDVATVLQLLSTDQARASEAEATLIAWMARDPRADPVTGCLPVTAPPSPQG